MAITSTRAANIRGIVTCVPGWRFDNVADTRGFNSDEVDKVVRMAGVKARRRATEAICSSDLCTAAARRVMERLGWDPSTVHALIFVTQTPDYLLPSTACLVHRDLGLSDRCASFDVGLGCSGYPYGLWLAAMMLQGPGIQRVLLLHGETPTRFASESDRSVALLFGDAGSATALEPTPADGNSQWWYSLHTDGTGSGDLILRGGGFRERFPEDRGKHWVEMNGANVFGFTIKRVPPLVRDTLAAAGLPLDAIDYFIFHQSNQFIIRHLVKKIGVPETKVPLILSEFGSAGGPSVPLTITQGGLVRPANRGLLLLLLGYGVGLSWGSALVGLPPGTLLDHLEIACGKPS